MPLSLLERIDGKKTHIAGALCIASGVFGLWAKVISPEIGLLLINGGLVTMGFRDALKKNGNNV